MLRAFGGTLRGSMPIEAGLPYGVLGASSTLEGLET